LVNALFCSSQSSVSEEWIGYLDYSSTKVPFSFSLNYASGKVVQVTLRNGDERIHLNQVKTNGDSIFIPLQPFDSYIKAKISQNTIEGIWEKPYRGLKVKIMAVTSSNRFSLRVTTPVEVGEKWAVTFKPGTSDAYPAVALLQQNGTKVTGTFLTEVGDFRYFEGVVDGDSLKMSSFDGAHAFYVKGKKTGDSWSGTFYFDPTYTEPWRAVIDDQAEIADPFELVNVQGSNLKPYYDILAAGNGKNAIDVKQLEGKVVVVQVFGTWCPNSLDETNFLREWYQTKPAGVELLAVTYEPNYSKEYGMRRIDEYKEHLSLPYDVYLGGQMSKSHAAIAFPFMDKIAAFPTLLLIDKMGNVRYIHAYFNGPATGSYYDEFKNAFAERVNELLRE
jgi:thiol-disulfide isomerase/thioredoxin